MPAKKLMNITGVPVKQRQIGSTGWVQVYTDKDLVYYYHELSWKGVWDCPRAVSEWIVRQRKESEIKDELTKQLSSRQAMLTEEQQLAEYAECIKNIVQDLKIPPIMTFDRAKPRLATHKDFTGIPEAFRQPAFDMARRVQFRKSAPMTLAQDFHHRLDTLRASRKIRPDHTVDDVLTTFFTDPKWTAIKTQLDSLRKVQLILDLAYQDHVKESDDLSRQCEAIVVKCVQPFLERWLEQSDEDALIESTRRIVDPLNVPPEGFLESLKGYLQKNIANPSDMAVYGKVCASESEDYVSDTLMNGCRQWVKKRLLESNKTLRPAVFEPTKP